ncbi:hypothetical protein KY360_04455 [Candidatus Woesearchaeota archaeon]|nr:hypothetical protein [Candidatus Woesearchaeota archaeon]
MGRTWAIHLRKQEPIVTIDDFVDTYRKPNTYQCRDGRDHLVARGDLPLHYTSPHLEDINILAAWLLWSGSISNYSAGICSPQEHKKGIKAVARRLGIKMIEHGPSELVFGEGGAPYVRLIASLGVPNGSGTIEDRDSKVKQKIELPDYVNFFMRHYNHLRGAERGLATKVLADQCKVLLYSRLRYNGTYELQTISSRSKKSARTLAEQIVNMFNTVYPMLGLGRHSIRTSYAKHRGYYDTSVRLGLPVILEGIRGYGLFNITLNPEYHVRGRRPVQKRD